MARTSILLALGSSLALLAIACGGQTIDPSQSSNPTPNTPAPAPVTCGGDSAKVTPRGTTYDDQVGSSSVTSIGVDMRIYSDASAQLLLGHGGACPAEGLVARSSQPVEIATGDYFICVDVGACNCARARLDGGPATFVWDAGPGGGAVSVTGCATSLR